MKLRTSIGKVLLLSSTILTFICLLLYYYVFNIYEVEIISIPTVVFADPSSQITVRIKPINALGWEVPFRNASGRFIITEGRDKVEIINFNEEEGFLTLRSIGVVGAVGIYVESEFSLFPSYIKIQFLPKSV